MSKCNDCGFEFSKYSIGGTSYHVDCPALKKRLVPMENNESVVEALTTELKQLRNIIAFYEIEIMPDGSFTSPRITQNEVDVKQLREFVGDIYTCRIGAGQGRWLNGEFTFFGKDAEVATGTDPFDAWQNLEGESK